MIGEASRSDTTLHLSFNSILNACSIFTVSNDAQSRHQTMSWSDYFCSLLASTENDENFIGAQHKRSPPGVLPRLTAYPDSTSPSQSKVPGCPTRLMTQYALLSQKFGFQHISMDDVLREKSDDQTYPHAELVKDCLEEEVDVPREVTVSLLERKMPRAGVSRMHSRTS